MIALPPKAMTSRRPSDVFPLATTANRRREVGESRQGLADIFLAVGVAEAQVTLTEGPEGRTGQSGNPAGRPKERPIAAALKNLGDKNDEEAIKAAALASEKVQRHVGGKEPRKVILVKGRLVNLVV